MNPVFILWLRQLKRYFRSRARMIGSLGQPTLFLLVGYSINDLLTYLGGCDSSSKHLEVNIYGSLANRVGKLAGM